MKYILIVLSFIVLIIFLMREFIWEGIGNAIIILKNICRIRKAAKKYGCKKYGYPSNLLDDVEVEIYIGWMERDYLIRKSKKINDV